MPRPAGPWLFLELFFVGLEKVWSNTFWYSTPAGMGTYPTQATAEDFYVAYSGIIANVMSANNFLIGSRTTINDGVDTVGYEYYHRTAGNISPPQQMPEDLAVVVQRIHHIAGKQNRGRIYVSGIDQSLITGSYLNATGTPLFAALATQMMAVINDDAGNPWTPCVYDRKDNLIRPLNATAAVGLIGTSRRRRSRF